MWTVVGCSEEGNERLGSIKRRELLDWLSHCYVLKKELEKELEMSLVLLIIWNNMLQINDSYE
jgi:hypothetical protein